MAVYYYACRLSAACGAASEPPAPAVRPSPRQKPISKQPTATKLKVNGIIPGKKKNSQLKTEVEMRLEEIVVDLPTSKEDLSFEEDGLCFDEDNLVSGRLEALVQHVVPSADYYPDRAFVFAFLLSSRLFIKPHELIGQIIATAYPSSKDKSKIEEPPEQLIQLLSEWSETFPYDFRDERVMSHMREVAHRCVSTEGPVRGEVSLLLQNLLHRLTKLEQYEAFLHSIHTASSTGDRDAVSQSYVSELCGTTTCLAEQLTHIEVERLSYIGPEEFVSCFARPENSAEPQLTRNYDNYIEWSSRLRSLVITEVCRHSKGKKQRASVIEFWINTAKECYEIGNLNSLMSIIEGLNAKPVARLKKTWSKVERSILLDLERATSDEEYASALVAPSCPGRHVVPHFPRHVATMHAVCRKCLNRLPNDHVNFEHVWQLAKEVTEFITWKQVHCPFPKQPKVITYLQATPVFNEEASFVASFECEPAEDEAEIEHHKNLVSRINSS